MRNILLNIKPESSTLTFLDEKEAQDMAQNLGCEYHRRYADLKNCAPMPADNLRGDEVTIYAIELPETGKAKWVMAKALHSDDIRKSKSHAGYWSHMRQMHTPQKTNHTLQNIAASNLFAGAYIVEDNILAINTHKRTPAALFTLAPDDLKSIPGLKFEKLYLDLPRRKLTREKIHENAVAFDVLSLDIDAGTHPTLEELSASLLTSPEINRMDSQSFFDCLANPAPYPAPEYAPQL